MEKKNDLLESVEKYLKDGACPNCGKKIDSIRFGKQGIRCEFCMGRNILEDFSFLSKISNDSVLMQSIVGCVSESGEKEVDENGKTVNSAWLKVHIDDRIFDGNIDDFIKKYITMIIFADRESVYTFLPHLKPQKIKSGEVVEEKDSGK